MDSALLLARVVVRRVVVLGPVGALRTTPPSSRSVLYVDCGVHKRGEQIRYMHEWFATRCDLRIIGFEASANHASDARDALADVPDVELRQLALVGPGNDASEVKLYRGSGGGKADSLYGSSASEHEVVPATRLSTLLREEFADLLDTAPILLRMNIEGSEFDVIEDLVATGLAPTIDGYFGMWDDVGKRDSDRDGNFRRMLRDARIWNVTFNDRDLAYAVRRRAIKLAFDTAIARGFRRKSNRAMPIA